MVRKRNAGLVSLGIALALAWMPVSSAAQRLEHSWSEERPLEFPPEFVEEGPDMSAGFYESLRMLTLWRLSEALNLGEDELVHFFPKFSEAEKARQRHREEKRSLLENLREALEDGDLKTITGSIDAYRNARADYEARSRRLEEDLLSVLTLEQQAEYLLFMENVAPEIEAMLRAFQHLRP